MHSNIDYEAMIPEVLQALKELQNRADGWEVVADGTCKGYKRYSEDNGVITKGVTKVNYPYQEVMDFISDMDTFKKMNDQCIQSKKLFEKKDCYQIHYCQFKTPFPLENRETVTISIRKKEGSKLYLASKSCDYPVETPKNVVRANCVIGGWVVEELTDKTCLVKHFNHMDPEGNIPDMLKNKMAEMRSVHAGQVEQLMRKRAK